MTVISGDSNKIRQPITFLLLAIALLISGTLTSAAQEKKSEPKKADVTFTVNMHCDNCKTRIEKALIWEKGVKDLDIKLKETTVRITFDPRKTGKEKLQHIIKELGYTCEINEPQTANSE
jgi:copper chaperone CopZ